MVDQPWEESEVGVPGDYVVVGELDEQHPLGTAVDELMEVLGICQRVEAEQQPGHSDGPLLHILDALDQELPLLLKAHPQVVVLIIGEPIHQVACEMLHA